MVKLLLLFVFSNQIRILKMDKFNPYERKRMGILVAIFQVTMAAWYSKERQDATVTCSNPIWTVDDEIILLEPKTIDGTKNSFSQAISAYTKGCLVAVYSQEKGEQITTMLLYSKSNTTMLLDEIKFGTKNTFVIKAKGALQKTLQCFNAESVEKLFGQPVTIQPMMGDTVASTLADQLIWNAMPLSKKAPNDIFVEVFYGLTANDSVKFWQFRNSTTT